MNYISIQGYRLGTFSHTHSYDHTEKSTEVMRCVSMRADKERIATATSSHLLKPPTGERNQCYTASIDLWLVVLRGQMQSIIDLGAIIKHPA